MKRYAFLIAIFLVACTPVTTEAAIPLGTPEISVPTETVTPTPTSTHEPTPTVGYQATAIAAQQTADAANRLMVEATSEHERRQYELLAFTAEAERRQMWLYGETATAAMTAIPATQTQAAMMADAIATQQSIMITSQVMTQRAPTMIVALANATSQAQFARIDAIVRIFALFGLGCFMLGIGLWLLRSPPKIVERAEDVHIPDAPEDPIIHPIDLGTVITVKNDQGGGFVSASKMMVPCTPEQLTELAEGLISGNKTLAINQWEGKMSVTFTRDVYILMRNFMQANRLVRSDRAGRLMLTADGEAFFRAWLEQRSIPPSYEFDPGSADITGKTAHEHENHAHDHAVGEAQSAPKAPGLGTVLA